MEGIPEEPGQPIKAGQLRNATDRVEAEGVEHLTDQMSESWRVEDDLIRLLEDVEEGRLGNVDMETAGKFHYRFVKIHPFCDGNGRMARALSNFLLAREDQEVLNFGKPINEVVKEHRNDYIAVLEYCDSIYLDLGDTPLPEEKKVAYSERPFVQFFVTAYLSAYNQHNRELHERLAERVADLPPFPMSPPGLYNLSFEEMRSLHPWNRDIKEAFVREERTST